MKVLFHLSDEKRFNVLEGNINNLLKEDNTVNISVVFNSKGVLALLNTNIKLLNNVNYYACNNSINSLNINKNDLIKDVKITKSGVYKIALLQSEGYLYIKP